MQKVLLFFLCFGFALCGCASSAPQISGAPQRSLPPTRLSDKSLGKRLIFEPRASYVVGLTAAKDFPQGAWVRAKPTEHWPSSEPAPTLFIGQVIERQSSWARVEVLSLVDSIRHEALNPEEISLPALTAITKRLNFGLTKPKAGAQEIDIALGSDNLRTGEEIYAAIDLEADPKMRFGARIKGLLTLSEKDQTTSTLHLALGSIPQNPVFILLGMQTRPKFNVQIDAIPKSCTNALAESVQDLDNALKISALLNNAVGIQSQKPTQSSPNRQSVHLGVSCDRSTLILHSELYRMSLLEPSPQLMSLAPTQLNACAIWLNAAQILGNYSAVVFLGEYCLSEYPTLEAYTMLGPALVFAYTALERPDWGTELALSLQGLNASFPNNVGLIHSELQAWSILGNAQKSAPLFEALAKRPKSLEPMQIEALLIAALRLYREGNEDFSQELERWTNYVRKQRITLDPKLLCLIQGLGDVDNQACQRLLASPDDKLSAYASTMLAISELSLPLDTDLLEAIDRLDSLFMPSLAALLLNFMAALTQADTLYMRLVHSEALQLWQGARFSAFAAVLGALDDYSYELRQSPFEESGTQEYLAFLSTMDKRTRLSRRSIRLALSPSCPQDDSINLLAWAAELAVSTGDEENAAIAYAQLAKAYLRAKLTQKASAAAQRAKDFAKNSHRPEILQLLGDVPE